MPADAHRCGRLIQVPFVSRNIVIQRQPFLPILSQRCVLSSTSSAAYSWIHGLPLFDTSVSIPSSIPREFCQDAAATAAEAAAVASQWTESVSFIADIDVRRLRLRPMVIVQGEEVRFMSSTFDITHENIYTTSLQVCLGSVDVCDARILVHTRAAPLHPSWLDSESQVRTRHDRARDDCGVFLKLKCGADVSPGQHFSRRFGCSSRWRRL